MIKSPALIPFIFHLLLRATYNLFDWRLHFLKLAKYLLKAQQNESLIRVQAVFIMMKIALAMTVLWSQN